MNKALSWLLGGRRPAASHLLLAPASLWLLFLLVIPAGGLIVLSFAKNGPYGAIVWEFGLQNYRRAFDHKYLPVLFRTLGFAGATTVLCLVLGYPLAYYLTFRAGRWRNALLVGLMVPFWSSCLVAYYSWMIVLGKEGLLNTALLRFGFLSSPIGFLYTPFAILLGLVYFYLPFTVLPLYASLDKVPRSVIEAAYDLGAGRWTAFWIVALMVPFWSSCLVAYYSWMIVLGKEGLINSALIRFGFLSSPIGFLYTPFAILLGLVYFYLPFTVLPLYASLDKVPRSVIEAAYDLGAGRWTAFFKVTLPLSLPGVVAGCILTFIPCLGDFLTVEILGGPRYYLLGNLISNQFMMAQDWPFGSALTSLLLAGLVGGLWLYQRWEKA